MNNEIFHENPKVLWMTSTCAVTYFWKYFTKYSSTPYFVQLYSGRYSYVIQITVIQITSRSTSTTATSVASLDDMSLALSPSVPHVTGAQHRGNGEPPRYHHPCGGGVQAG